MERPLNILIIEDDANTCNRFVKYTENNERINIVSITNNAYRAISITQESMPDAIILDLELHEGKGSGLLFLQELKKLALSIKPFILITTNNSSSTIYTYARELGADFIMYKHEDDYSEKKAIDFLIMMKEIIQNNMQPDTERYENLPVENDDSKRIQRLVVAELNAVGISPRLIGYKYLTEAIILVINDDTQNINGKIAAKYGKTDTSVERAMQNAINKAWRSSDIDDLLENYTARINSEKGVPTLTEFIYYYATKIQNL